MILLAAAIVALAASRVAADPAGPRGRSAGANDAADILGFAVPTGADSAVSTFIAQLRVDPLENRAEIPVAPTAGTPTLSTTRGQARRLTAILIADNRPVAVIDDRVVEVGAMLPDGARVSSIQADRVWVVEKTGKWHMLVLSSRTP